MMVSSVHNVCKKGFNIAIVSTNVETNNPHKELDPAFEIIGPVSEKFFTVSVEIINFRFLMYMFRLMMAQRIIFLFQLHLTQHHTSNLKQIK